TADLPDAPKWLLCDPRHGGERYATYQKVRARWWRHRQGVTLAVRRSQVRKNIRAGRIAQSRQIDDVAAVVHAGEPDRGAGDQRFRGLADAVVVGIVEDDAGDARRGQLAEVEVRGQHAGVQE